MNSVCSASPTVTSALIVMLLGKDDLSSGFGKDFPSLDRWLIRHSLLRVQGIHTSLSF